MNEEMTKEEEEFMKALSKYLNAHNLPDGFFRYSVEILHSKDRQSYTYFNWRLTKLTENKTQN